ncbi:MAG: response regulator transcription factor [Melioribacteraceae bacterium]|jgi:DNA-binding LytR/AlgR family response regulator|nr:response regulator transcription factor [Melioribacteraceae bacterium]
MKKKILIIEDNLRLLENIKDILEEENYEVQTAADGSKGIELALQSPPDIIICDIVLPNIDGFEVLQEISTNDSTRNIPFIFLTAKAGKEDLRQGMRLGAADYIFKPFEFSDLLDSIRLRLQKSVQSKTEIRDDENFDGKENYKISEKIIFNYTGKPIMCSINDIKYLKSETPYIKIKLRSGKNVLRRETLKKWEDKLPSKYFIRIHRSTIVNTNYINKIERLSKVSYLIHLADETETFILSKRARSKFKKKYS